MKSRICRIKRSIRAISPVISVLLMIAIAVVASLVVYAWVMGYIGFQTGHVGKAVQIQSIAISATGDLVVYVQNVGQGTVGLDPAGSLYANDTLQPSSIDSSKLDPGQTATITATHYPIALGDIVKVKVASADGTFSQVTQSPAGNAAASLGPAVSLVVSGFPNPATSGVAGSVTVTAKDSNGVTATGYAGTVHFTSSDGQAVLPADYAFVAGDAGVHSFSVTLKTTAGTQSITATDTVTGTITGSQAGIVVNAPANNPPVATDDAYTTTSGSQLTVNAPGVLTNDHDPDAGDTLAAVLVNNVAHGTLNLNANGGFTYTSTGFTGADTFTYYANDGKVNSNSAATVTITVNPGTGTFGYQTIGTSYYTMNDMILGSVYTMGSQGGTGSSITAYISTRGNTRNIKAAIYTASGGFVASTDPQSINNNGGWVTFNFPSGSRPTLTAGTQYALVLWSDNDVRFYRLSTSSVQVRYRDINYGTWPNPGGFTSDTNEYSIYLTYSIP